MKANELRVGNWVNDELYGDFQIVGLINFKDGNQSAYKSLEYYPQSQDTDKLNPIPLTEEWLLKFGFEKTFITKIHCNFNKGTFSLLKRDNHIQIWYENINVQYVHQLQNLYFAITNEELI
jgi:hypothetical protein